MKLNPLIVIGYLSTILLTGCGGGGAVPATGTSSISGTLLAPDNATPIAGATVYTLASSETNIQATPTGNCPAPTVSYHNYSCTTANGQFELASPQDARSVLLVFEKGFFRTQHRVDLMEGQTAIGNVSLPAEPNNGAGRFAVIEGTYDRMEDILAKLGMGDIDPVTHQLIPGTEKFDLYPEVLPLFEDNDNNGLPDIFRYDVVFINCGQFDEETILANHRQTLHDYVSRGGVLYITDQAYDFVEQVFPEYLDFYGDDSVPAATAEAMHRAETGQADIQVKATVMDTQLRDWLATVSCNNGPCLNADNTVTIGGFLSNWAVFHGGHAGSSDTITTWSSGPVSFFDFEQGVVMENIQKPLTVTLNIGQGKVLYSSYHTDELLFSAGFKPQERILQYLIFEL